MLVDLYVRYLFLKIIDDGLCLCYLRNYCEYFPTRLNKQYFTTFQDLESDLVLKWKGDLKHSKIGGTIQTQMEKSQKFLTAVKAEQN